MHTEAVNLILLRMENSFSEMCLAICNEKNSGVWGFELIKRMQAFLTDEIKQRGRMKEAIKIVRECTEIFQSKKDFISDVMVQQIVRDKYIAVYDFKRR